MSWLYTIVFAGLVFSSNENQRPLTADVIESCPAVIEQQAADETEKFEKSYPLNANGRVNVANVNGSITVEAWDRNEVKLEYTKIADTKERLAEVEVEIESRPEYFRAETNYDNWKRTGGDRWRNNGKLNVEFKLWVPKGAVLNEIETVNGSVTVSNFVNTTVASAVNGSVTATNIRGAAKLSTVNGTVRADFDRLESGSKISLETVNGTVNLLLPSDSNATVRAESLNGNISNGFGLPVRKGKYVGRDLYGKIGSGDVQIKLESVNGGLSIDRKNDGKSQSPAVDLLQQKSKDSEDWDSDFDAKVKVDAAKMNKQIAKAVKDSVKVSADISSTVAEKALSDAAIELHNLGPELAKVNADAMRQASREFAKAADLAQLDKMRDTMRDSQRVSRDALNRLSEAAFFPSIPRVEKKSDSFPVKGVPKVEITGRGCSVTVKGWDRPEVQYRVVQYSDPRNRQPINVKENHNDSSVNIKVDNPAIDAREGTFRDSRRVHIEVFVPKKSNLKIDANGTIRLDGVSGELQVIGGDENIDVRDSDGKLNVTNQDGQLRIVGFRGDLVAKTQDGNVRLDGDFTSINGQAGDGNFVLIVPEDVDADISGSGESGFSVRFEDMENGKQTSENNWRFGKGSKKYKFKTVDGAVTVQNRDRLVADNR